MSLITLGYGMNTSEIKIPIYENLFLQNIRKYNFVTNEVKKEKFKKIVSKKYFYLKKVKNED